MYLASKSPQRQALLESLGIDFEIVLPEYDEVDPPGASPAELVERHSFGKASSVAERLAPLPPQKLVIGVDTMVVIEGKAIGKARDEEQALDYLKRLSGSTHQVYSGLTLIWGGGKDADSSVAEGDVVGGTAEVPLRERTGHAVTEVRFSRIPEDELISYVDTGEWRGRAGAYAIQERASAFVEEIHGDYTNVVGLPVPLLVGMLREYRMWPPKYRQ